MGMIALGSIPWIVGSVMAGIVVGTIAAAQDSPETPPWEFRDFVLSGGESLRCAVVLPEDYDPAVAHPVLLGLPPGDQSERMVIAGLTRYWGREAAARGWVVVSPVAPEGKSFVREAAESIPRLVRAIHAEFRAEGGRVHVAGVSNGGRSAFRAAIDDPAAYHSVTVLPGFPPEDADERRLYRLRELPLAMFAGGNDEAWVSRMQRTRDSLVSLGASPTLEIFPGEGHVPPSLTGGRLFETLEARRSQVAARPVEELAIAAVLDGLHEAAARGDENEYFARFTQDAQFIGTDASERWPIAEFRSWSARYFARGSAWVYRPATRHITVSADRRTAWFHELVDHDTYGECRGTGTLVHDAERWQIAQYALTFPVPNDRAREVVEAIRRGSPNPVSPRRVFVVRHAEKESDPSADPALSDAGRVRAERLAQWLAALPLRAILVSDTARTRATAAPTAAAQSLEFTVVDQRDATGLADRLAREPGWSDTLVVGHSNTVPTLLRALGIDREITMDESMYDRLFIVRLEPDAPAEVIELRY